MESLEICVWKCVANRDKDKLERGDECITFNLNSECFKCDGTREYAEKIKCNKFAPPYKK